MLLPDLTVNSCHILSYHGLCSMLLGPVMLGLEALELTAEEYEMLQHPLVGGIILFTRNYQSPEQITSLVSAIHAARQPPLLVAVDHEGGSVQRFRDGFSRLPAMRDIGKLYDQDTEHGLHLARTVGWLMATELRTVGVDFSFAPVLDLDYGVSAAIRDRAFHRNANSAIELASAYIKGMSDAGMAAVGKHFPGHGFIAADSHHEIPVDKRSFDKIQLEDLRPFSQLIANGLPAIIPALVIYQNVDPHPAGFSAVWLQKILRQQLGFNGVVFSDDLGMVGASYAGGPLERAQAALAAGCDMVLACNERSAALAMLEGLNVIADQTTQARLQRMQATKRPATIMSELPHNPIWQAAVALLDDMQTKS